MRSNNKIHAFAAILINLIVVTFVVTITIKTNSDKSYAVFIFYYLFLLIVNLVLFLILQMFNKKEAKIYRTTLLGLLLIFAPLTIFISNI